MPFGNISTLYLPIAANAGASQWGTDVRKLLSAAETTFDSTSITDHGGGGAVTRTVDPYSLSSADSVQADFGWAIAPADMGSVSGAKRFMRAGNHVATIRMDHNAVTAVNATLFVYVYRVGPAPGRTRTLLGSNSAIFSLPINAAQATATVTVALDEIIFEADETLQYSFEVSCAGVAVTGRRVTFFTGTTPAVASRVDIPTLRVLADTTGSATGSGEATGTTGKVLATVGSAAGSVSVGGVGASRAATTGAATGSGDATGQASAVAGTTGTAVGLGTATGALGGIGGMVGTAAGVGTATGALGGIGGMVGTAAGSGVATGVLGATGATVGTAVGTGTALAQASSVAGTTGAAAGSGVAAGVAGVVIGTTGTVNIGSSGAEVIEVIKAPPIIRVDGDPAVRVADKLYTKV